MSFGGIKITTADRWFSFYVRFVANWTCQHCFRECKARKYNNPDLPLAKIETAHFFSRANKSTRLDPEAAVALCFKCHGYYSAHETEWTAWLIKLLGSEDRYWLLKKKSQTPMVGYEYRHKAIGEQFKEEVLDMAEESGRLWVIGVSIKQ
jgi:hypothetical protein